MDIFIISTAKADSVPQEMLETYGYKKYTDKKKEQVHRFTYLMLDRILENFYKIDLTEKNIKPQVYKTGSKNFSVSHSGEYIAIAFSDFKCGIDIEKIKPRNYQKISERMKFDSGSLKEFYINWTKYEANYKLGTKSNSEYCLEIPQYAVTAVSEKSDETFDVYYSL